MPKTSHTKGKGKAPKKDMPKSRNEPWLIAKGKGQEVANQVHPDAHSPRKATGTDKEILVIYHKPELEACASGIL